VRNNYQRKERSQVSTKPGASSPTAKHVRPADHRSSLHLSDNLLLGTTVCWWCWWPSGGTPSTVSLNIYTLKTTSR
jgi:hypothetical protein